MAKRIRFRPHIIFIFFLLMLPGISSGQYYVHHIDNFTHEANGWESADNHYYIARLLDDHYYILRKAPNAKQNFWINTPVGNESYISFEAKIAVRIAQDKDGEGICWGSKDLNNYYAFVISVMKRSARIYKVENGIQTDIMPWKPINDWTKGAYNYLQVVCDGNGTSFLLDNKEVFSTYKLPFKGNMSGLMVRDIFTEVFTDFYTIKYKGEIKLVSKDTLGEKKKLGNEINSEFDDHSPVISPDGKTLYFTRKHPSNPGGSNNEDIWYTKLINDSTWSPARPLPAPLNNFQHNGVLSTSSDNRSILLNGDYQASIYGGGYTGALSMATKTERGWTYPKKISIDNYYNYNAYISANISADGKTLLLGLERKDGYGDADIYVSFLQEDNTWSEPMNLGRKLNTPAKEHDPFLAADGATLYFATEGRPGYGSTDIFISHRLDDSWTNWSEPENLGPVVNTPGDDGEFFIDAAGNYAYLSGGDRNTERDIYRMKLPEKAKPKPVALLSGVVKDCKGKALKNARISYFDIDSLKERSVTHITSGDTSFKMVLPLGKKYIISVSDTSFKVTNDTLDLSQYFKYTEITHDVTLCQPQKPVNYPDSINNRPVNIQQAMEIKHRHIKLALWDDEKQDGDYISLNVNGKWVLENIMLLNAKRYVEIELNSGDNYIIMFAHNEGRVPPNTAAISIVDGDKERRIQLKSTLKNSASIYIRVNE